MHVDDLEANTSEIVSSILLFFSIIIVVEVGKPSAVSSPSEVCIDVTTTSVQSFTVTPPYPDFSKASTADFLVGLDIVPHIGTKRQREEEESIITADFYQNRNRARYTSPSVISVLSSEKKNKRKEFHSVQQLLGKRKLQNDSSTSSSSSSSSGKSDSDSEADLEITQPRKKRRAFNADITTLSPRALELPRGKCTSCHERVWQWLKDCHSANSHGTASTSSPTVRVEETEMLYI